MHPEVRPPERRESGHGENHQKIAARPPSTHRTRSDPLTRTVPCTAQMGFLGYVGFWNTLIFAPVAVILAATGVIDATEIETGTVRITQPSSAAALISHKILLVLRSAEDTAHSSARFRATLQVAFIIVMGLIDNVCSDYLWARGVLLTTPAVVTCGVSLQARPAGCIPSAALHPSAKRLRCALIRRLSYR